MSTHEFGLARLVRTALPALLAVWCWGAEAQVPDQINYQGRLTDSSGSPITGTVPMVFRLYTVASGGAALYAETQSVTVTAGVFNVAIGSVTTLTLPFDLPYYLGITAGADAEMTPRQPLLSTPYALHAANSDALAVAATVDGAQITGSISVATVPASQLTGTIGTAQIANNAVTQAKLSPGGAAAGNVLGTDGTNLVWQSAGSGGGTVTSVDTGAGLSGGPITSSGTVNLAATQLLPVVACASGQAPSWNGSAWACADPTSFTGNITLAESSSASVGNIMKGGNSFIHNYGGGNTFVGEIAGNFTMTGGDNAGFGYGTLNANTAGTSNTAVGVEALFNNTTGTANTAVGDAAAIYNTTGSHNTAMGYIALYTNDSGSFNTAIGDSALFSNTTGSGNTASGNGALYANTTGGGNTAVGLSALLSNTTGIANIAIGLNALQDNTVGNFNTAIGNSALYSNTTGTNNVANGDSALHSNTTGGGNTASGDEAMLFNTIGFNNTANGASALYSNITGAANEASGTGALYANTSGGFNTASGYNALFTNTTGNSNTAVGASADVASGNLTNATAIGTFAIVDASNHVRIGSAAVTQIGGQVAWSNLSDMREKEDIRDLSFGLDFVMALRPVEFRMRNGNDRIDFGFIAQDVEGLLGTNYNVLGIGGTAERKLSLRYTDFIAPIVHALQEQQRLVEAQAAELSKQTAEIALLKQDRQAQIARIDALEAHAAQIAALEQQLAQMAQLEERAAQLAAPEARLAAK